MELLFLIRTAYVDLKRNKVRSLLTSLGILIGVFSVVTLIAFGLGLRGFIQEQFAKIGTNLVIVFPGNFSSDQGGYQDSEGGLGMITFDQRDFQALQRIKVAKYVVPAFIKVVKIEAGGESKVRSLFASTADIFPVQNCEIEYGRLFTEADVRKEVKIAVLGSKVAEEHFGSGQNAVGKTVRLDDQRFKVVGVLKAKGGGLGGRDFDTFIYTPYTAAYVFNPDKTFAAFYMQAKNKEDIPELKSEAQKILEKRYDKEDFSVIEQTEILGIVDEIFGMINLLLVALGSISLVVGGVGIMNIMYASVTERTKEVGIRRALGATKQDILVQFLSEAVILALFGGLAGLGIATVGVIIARHWFPAAINLMSIGLALGVSSVIGITFGVFPARKAATLPPIEAIRRH